jgi:N-acetylated-alpha-linked acidic dipeptidase
VQFLSLYPGDPATPGKPAYEDTAREEGTNIPKIPSLPISWANAQQILKEIGEGEQRIVSGRASKREFKLVNRGRLHPSS